MEHSLHKNTVREGSILLLGHIIRLETFSQEGRTAHQINTKSHKLNIFVQHFLKEKPLVNVIFTGVS